MAKEGWCKCKYMNVSEWDTLLHRASMQHVEIGKFTRSIPCNHSVRTGSLYPAESKHTNVNKSYVHTCMYVAVHYELHTYICTHMYVGVHYELHTYICTHMYVAVHYELHMYICMCTHV